MSGSWRTESELIVVSRLAGSPLRATFYVDPWRQEIPKIRRGNRWFSIDLSFQPYGEAFDIMAPTARPGAYCWLPFAADTSIFRERGLERDIDILWMGRRHEPLHQAMLEYCDAKGLTYLFRERTGFIDAPEELGKLASRARYFACTPSDLGGPRDTGGFSPLIMRYFEGLAAGSRLIGVMPGSGKFEHFLPRDCILEVAADGSDFVAKFEADQSNSTRFLEVEAARQLVDCEHGWNARARNIVDEIEARLS